MSLRQYLILQDDGTLLYRDLSGLFRGFRGCRMNILPCPVFARMAFSLYPVR